MNKVEAPIMGIYEVQNCPNCGIIPYVDVSIKRDDNIVCLKYTLSEEVYCTCCGLSAPSVDIWNRLSCN